MTSEYEIAFALVRGMSVDLARKILDVVESEQNFFVLKQSELEGIIGAKNRILESAYRNEILEKARREMEFVNANSIDLYYFRDAAFPQRMLDAIDAPILLFGKGPVNLNAARLVSVVGTRHATQYGKAITDKIIGELAEMYPDHKAFELEGVEKRFNMFDKVCGSDQIRLRFTKNYNVADIIDYWNKDVEAFKARSAKYYLYK